MALNILDGVVAAHDDRKRISLAGGAIWRRRWRRRWDVVDDFLRGNVAQGPEHDGPDGGVRRGTGLNDQREPGSGRRNSGSKHPCAPNQADMHVVSPRGGPHACTARARARDRHGHTV